MATNYIIWKTLLIPNFGLVWSINIVWFDHAFDWLRNNNFANSLQTLAVTEEAKSAAYF